MAFALIWPAAAPPQEYSSTYGPLPVFEFHSGFWVNLHHMLYYEARLRGFASFSAQEDRLSPKPGMKTMEDASISLTPEEQAAWNDAVSYYVTNYANKDPLFNNDLVLLKNQLGDFEDCDELSGAHKKTCDAGLPGNLTRVLDAAAPVYRAHLWPDQDRSNRRWIARVAPLVIEQGVGVSQRLADIYQTKWPKEKIRVDVSAYANSSGAYTTLDPLRVTISSTDPRNQGDEAFQVLFYQASHGIAVPVQLAINRECRQRDKAIPRDLWPALILFTTVEVIQPLLPGRGTASPESLPSSDSGPAGALLVPRDAYTPYAVRDGLTQRGWNEYYELLIRFWQSYLDNKSTFDDAIARMVSAL